MKSLIDLFLFRSGTAYDRTDEIRTSIMAWVSLLGVIVALYSALK